jgi:hypothetical protein
LTSLLSLSVTVAVSIAIALSVVPVLVDCCISPNHHCFRRHGLCCLAVAIAVAIASTGVVHALVDQKLVKSNKIMSFNRCPEYEL